MHNISKLMGHRLRGESGLRGESSSVIIKKLVVSHRSKKTAQLKDLGQKWSKHTQEEKAKIITQGWNLQNRNKENNTKTQWNKELLLWENQYDRQSLSQTN